ncbi:hypothetical protein BKA62DRAFT_177684 [Auriculariales sp. MPI-PUGE-AT-0066]|nr:hypothetical protein BKA62DRAFT_177684 [Auriculariales sp. MPI-PUGE-AT-0066]
MGFRWPLVIVGLSATFEALRSGLPFTKAQGVSLVQTYFDDPSICTNPSPNVDTSVTFNLVNHSANPFWFQETTTTAEALLRNSADDLYSNSFKRLFSSSFGDPNVPLIGVRPSSNGLVYTILDAYSRHHALVIRPDDIWLAIATQFSFFVNGRAEELRDLFVTHQGQEKMLVYFNPGQDLFSGAELAAAFGQELEKRLADPTLRHWIMPSFSTTTDTDRVVGSAVLMGTMKKYYTYFASMTCGIPRITLEGTQADWEDILRRVDKLLEYGLEAKEWHMRLAPVLRRFVATFDDPALDRPETRAFWENMVQYDGTYCGGEYISGWITAFCQFDKEGSWIHGRVDPSDNPTMIDGIAYPILDFSTIPPGYVSVNISLEIDETTYEAELVAGLVGKRVLSSHDTTLSTHGENDTLAPSASWWLFEKLSEEEQTNRLSPAFD